MSFESTPLTSPSERWYYNGPESGTSFWGFFNFGASDRSRCREYFKSCSDLFDSELNRINVVHEFASKILNLLQVDPPDCSQEIDNIQRSTHFCLTQAPLDSIFTTDQLFFPYNQFFDYHYPIQMQRCQIWNNKDFEVRKSAQSIFHAIECMKNLQKELREQIAREPACTIQFPQRRIDPMSYSFPINAEVVGESDNSDLLHSRDTLLADLTRFAGTIIQKLGATLPNIAMLEESLQTTLDPKVASDWKKRFSIREEIFKTYFHTLNRALVRELGITESLTAEFNIRQVLRQVGQRTV